ncbi:uncharacterized protein L969DRAFT_25906 [Mixia osmundae IAM 14324]|uniref:uncharacterized protein n=1 Tax=Mixia osmundae (strain CBS 9802 / IAM 14324 / JCM 22182 / KY 12970) TaxID=764103 RepID=UPI0004A559B2|nr:uncharacterized protein L969DRAFT_25906 [Mixia osmundae IAM 14324]KEI37478.1 hypothetical protein L969DRAFT_25906 [Mixia osmundae IAM 14324]
MRDPQGLYILTQTLEATLLPDAAVRAAAEKQLLEWARRDADPHAVFYECLLDIVAARDHVSLGARTQAMLIFKNGVEKYWRRSSDRGLPQSTKIKLRRQLLSLIEEPDRSIANTLSLCIGRVARHDYPSEWPTLLTDLLSILAQGDQQTLRATPSLLLQRTLQTLFQVVKLLATSTLARGRQIAESLGEDLFRPVHALHERLRTSWDALLSSGGMADEALAVQTALSCQTYKILSKLVIFGWKQQRESELCRAFYHSSIESLPKIVALRRAFVEALTAAKGDHILNNTTYNLLESITRICLANAKFFRKFWIHRKSELYAMGSIDAMMSNLWLLVEHASTDIEALVSDQVTAIYPERLLVQGLITLSLVFGEPPQDMAQMSDANFALHFTRTIATKLLPLTDGDIAAYNDDAEAWLNEEEADRWEYNLRPASAHLFSILLSRYPRGCAATLELLAQSSQNDESSSASRQREALYYAYGLGPTALGPYCNIIRMINDSIQRDALTIEPGTALLRRRIAWLLGAWQELELSSDELQAIYPLLVHLVVPGPGRDIAVRLSAAKSLNECNTWRFSEILFEPFLPPAIAGLTSLLAIVTSQEGQSKAIDALGNIVARMGTRVTPYAQELLQVLCKLWSQDINSLLRISIVVAATKLAVETDSEGLHEPLMTILHQCLVVVPLPSPETRRRMPGEAKAPGLSYLHEDALELLRELVAQSNEATSSLRTLIPVVISIIASATDTLLLGLEVIKGYCWLQPSCLLPHLPSLCAAFDDIVELLYIRRDLKPLLHCLSIIIKTQQSAVWAPDTAAFLLARLAALLEREYTETPIVVQLSICFARFFVSDPYTSIELCQRIDALSAKEPGHALRLILRTWSSKFDNFAEARHRKLVALGMSGAISTGSTVALSMLAELVPALNDALAETEETATGDADAYKSGSPDGTDLGDFLEAEKSAQAVRRQAYLQYDPVHSRRLMTSISNDFASAQRAAGGLFEQALGQVDEYSIGELKQRLSGRLQG